MIREMKENRAYVLEARVTLACDFERWDLFFDRRPDSRAVRDLIF